MSMYQRKLTAVLFRKWTPRSMEEWNENRAHVSTSAKGIKKFVPRLKYAAAKINTKCV